MSIAPGTRLASYDVLSLLGAGGMGEVYRARDTRLGRDVAIKVLPESFALDPDRVTRFTREAKMLASLNHPGIAAIYGIEEQGATRALVIELVDGEDLSQIIARGPLPAADALAIARQIADALDAAHGAGVIHRDLKPANIKVKADGTVKVLDFGLAKAGDATDSSASQLANSPTLTGRATQMGLILGTAAYMAPEQARGRAVDRRADIWALGVTLYEMLTGRRAFGGDDISITLASVLKDDVDWTALPAATPPALVRLLRRCLAKDPKARLRDAGDVRLEIDEVLAGPTTDSTAGRPRARRRFGAWIAVAAALMAVAALAAAVAWRMKPAGADVPLRKFSVRGKDGVSIFNAIISPDGRSLAFVVGSNLWVRRFDTLEAQEIPGAEDVHTLFWSPDSTAVGFQTKTQLWKVAATGGNPAPICRVPREFSDSGGAIWLPDDRIVFTTGGSGLMEVSALGGEPHVLLAPDLKKESDFHQVAALPGGKGFLFVPHPVNGDFRELDVFDGANRRTLLTLEEHSHIMWPAYSPTGHVVYEMGGSVWAVPFALDRVAITGTPFRVAAGAGHPSVAEDGTLSIVASQIGAENLQLTWVNAKGDLVDTVGRKGNPLAALRVSRDGRQAVGASITTPGASDLWIVDLVRHTERRLTYEPGINTYPSWSRDGQHIVYECAAKVCVRPADGTGQPAVLVPAPALRPGLSPDGAALLFVREQPVTQLDIFQVPLNPSAVMAPPVDQPKPFLALERMQNLAEVSPAGSYAAYWSNESGVSMIYLTEFPSGRGKWQVGQGQWPRWSPKGDRLYYNVGDGITAVDISTTPALGISEPRTALPANAGIIIPGLGFEVSADGSRFLVNRSTSFGGAASVTIVQNWIAEFAGRGKGKS
jgi:eukaryotic-like serine/threonine-protein kinase